MRICRVIGLGVAGILFAGAAPAFGQEIPAAPPPDEFFRGLVMAVTAEQEQTIAGASQIEQTVTVRLDGNGGTVVEAAYTDVMGAERARVLRPGDRVVVARAQDLGQTAYYVVDRYRLPPIIMMALLFVVMTVAFSRVRGLSSLVGLAITVVVLVQFIVPRILAGDNPLVITVGGALVIAFVSIYLAHGFNRRTTIAVAGTLITLGIAAGLAIAFVSLAALFGAGSEEAFYLQLGLQVVNLRGLLLGGIILGALGVLDDITTGQAAAVQEISLANPQLGPRELYRRGLSVGTEHITALVNTLFLAYAGASLPLFILFTVNVDQPMWVTVNSEFVAEEIVRTLVGSSALVLAVPITTLLASRLLRARPRE
ncbi:MAG: YibE/F family protein [bacterium]